MFSNLTSVAQSGKSKQLTASALVATIGAQGGVGVVNAIIVSSHTSGTIKLWDNTAASGTILVDTYTYGAGSSIIPLYGPTFVKGLYADMNGTTQSITIVYNI